jgi:hypothetical protein
VKTNIFLFIVVVAVASLVGWQYYDQFGLTLNHDRSNVEVAASWGAFGDYIGGVLNPLIAGVGLIFFIITLKQNQQALGQAEIALEQAEGMISQGHDMIKQNITELMETRKEFEQSRIAHQELTGIEKTNFEDRRVNQALENSRMRLDVYLIDLNRALKISWLTEFGEIPNISLGNLINQMYGNAGGITLIKGTKEGGQVIEQVLKIMINASQQLEDYQKLCDRHGVLMAHELEGFLHHTSIFLVAAIGHTDEPNDATMIKDTERMKSLYLELAKKHGGFIGKYISKWNLTVEDKNKT